jgi:hypothetical protein
VPEAKVVKNRVHLDLAVSGGRGTPREERRRLVDAEADRLVAAGASFFRVLTGDGADYYAVVMQDPEGNEFCLHWDLPAPCLSAVVGLDQGVGAAVEAVGVVVPQPHVQGHQVRVPEVEPGAGLGAALGALVLRCHEHEGAVGVVAGGGEGAVGGAGQRWGGGG